MLSSVHIENIALIKSLDINFTPGFCAFTGETGAGKSIVIDAIGLACGAKVSKEIIRTGEREARVELLFSELDDKTIESCNVLGVSADEDGCIFITRTLDTDGKGSVTLNGRRIPLSLLRDVSSLLINIHGQHDNADLLKNEKHLGILDSFAENEKERHEYSEVFSEYVRIKERISSLSLDDKEKKRKIDILKFQIDEIKSAKLKEGEEEKLVAEKKRLLYSEKINKNASLCYRSLYDSETGHSALDAIERAIGALNALDGIVDGVSVLSERLENVKSEIIDIAETANDFADTSVIDSDAALDRIESRLDKIKKLCSRYGADISEVLEFLSGCERELSDIELSETAILDLQKELDKTEKKLSVCAEKLCESRKKAAKRLSAAIEEQLKYLDMKSSKFDVSFEKLPEFTQSGTEKSEFLIKINNGEGFHSLAKTASGGELSRVMLALKTVLSDKEGADTLIFDEIDTGISGSTSRRIGLKLKSLARKKQVLCVTHSAQVASLSDTHFKISKKASDARTVTEITELTKDEKIKEIARIISGMDVTASSLDSARELIENTDE